MLHIYSSLLVIFAKHIRPPTSYQTDILRHIQIDEGMSFAVAVP
jgi:hypothetical protein